MIDLHQHPGHFKKTVEDILAHTEALGGRMAVLLPVSSGEKNCLTNTEACREAAEAHPGKFVWFCVSRPDAPDALEQLEASVKAGARGFGEHKVPFAVDDPRSMDLYRLAGDLGVPVLLHFEEGNYNSGFKRFDKVLAALPKTNFIGHAQTWWANISTTDTESTGYPKTPVTPVGLTDRWLSDYPNLYADLSAGSGLNACERDVEFYRGFIKRHRKKLLFATDCPCTDGHGAGWEGGVCFGEKMLPHLRELCESDEVYEDITDRNVARLLNIA